MKAAILLLALFGAAFAAPSEKNDFQFRNLYREPLVKVNSIGRIVNGQVAPAHSIPYQVFLIVYAGRSGWYCGGSLISPNYVLTAGHCGYEGEEAEVTLGAQDINRNEASQTTLTSTTIIVHRQFNMDRILYDIALIKLPSAAPIGDYVRAATLPRQADARNTYENDIGKASGWGLVSGNSNTISDQLRFTENPIMSNRACNRIYGIVEDYQICMSGDGGHSTCSGDSGGPLTVDGVLVGVVSYGIEGCEPGYPSAFTRVTSFLDWIQSNSDIVISR